MNAARADMNAEPGQAARRHYDLAGPAGDFPEWHGPPRATLIICTQPRSGSTLLGEALYFAGGLGCPLEYLHPGFRPSFEARWNVSALSDYLQALYRNRTDTGGLFSLKLFWDDIPILLNEAAPGSVDWSASQPTSVADARYRDVHARLQGMFPNPRYIWLRRSDTVAQAVSVSVANQRRRWRQIDASDPAHRRDVAFRFDPLLGALARIQRRDAHWQRFFDANRIAPIALTYEALADDYQQEVAKLLTLLGREGAPIPPPRLKKQADAQSARIVDLFRKRFGMIAGSRP